MSAEPSRNFYQNGDGLPAELRARRAEAFNVVRQLREGELDARVREHVDEPNASEIANNDDRRDDILREDVVARLAFRLVEVFSC